MSKKPGKTMGSRKKTITGVSHVKTVGGIAEYTLKSNQLRILHKRITGTGIVTSNITYIAGAKDEERGETGIAHMLEHMLFKPTKKDLKHKVDSGAMQFERETGCILNANTWKDRTTYFFSYPREHAQRALSIEADRMENVVLGDKEFQPERSNVLSEFDMYFGDPQFALSVAMVGTALQSHPYGHETIGYREDIEDYTTEKLERFYRNYYRPDNATLMIFGDIELEDALTLTQNIFGKIKNPKTPVPRYVIREPKQEGRRMITIERQSTTNIIALGTLHAGFPTKDWYLADIALMVLAQGSESLLQKLLIDTGKAASVDTMIEPTAGINLAITYITLSATAKRKEIESLVLRTIKEQTVKSIDHLVKKAVQHYLTDEAFLKTSSLRLAMHLTEYTAAGDWSKYGALEKTLRSITTKEVLVILQSMFSDERLTVGNFVGTNK